MYKGESDVIVGGRYSLSLFSDIAYFAYSPLYVTVV
jgi:hypothetical protein